MPIFSITLLLRRVCAEIVADATNNITNSYVNHDVHEPRLHRCLNIPLDKEHAWTFEEYQNFLYNHSRSYSYNVMFVDDIKNNRHT